MEEFDDLDVQMTSLYTIYDVKAKIYSPPVSFDSTEAFQQYLAVLINTHGTGHYHLYPEDFVAYKIGYWNDDTGEILITDKKIVVNLAGLKKPCKYCNSPEEIANEQSKQILERSAS